MFEILYGGRENMELIQADKRLCTCCMEEHEVKRVRIVEHTCFKKIEVEYTAEYFLCDLAEELYMDENLIELNDMSMKDAYRRIKGLLTAQEIRNIRLQYEITQTDLCTLLGWGGKTITRYEGHQVQDKAQDSILKKLKQDPEWFLELLEEAKHKFSMEVFEKYYNAALNLYKKNQDKYLRKFLETKYAGYRTYIWYNGNTILNLDKVVDLICYLANSVQVTDLYKMKLMKLIWYVDFLSYKLRNHAMTGLVYQILSRGAVPVGHDAMIGLEGISYVEIENGTGIDYQFCRIEKKEYLYLSKEDKIIIDVVVNKLGNRSKDEIGILMQKEQAVQETEERAIVLYSYAQYLQI